jgi:hypothetical protein
MSPDPKLPHEARQHLGGRSKFRLLSAALPLIFALSAGAATTHFTPLTSGEWGDVNARDGDRAFNVEYFHGLDLRGPAFAARLEPFVGSEPDTLSLTHGEAYSARWSATVTPARSGMFPVALRSTGAAVLKVDGRVVLTRPKRAGKFDQRTTGSVEMQRGKPYEFVVEFRNPAGTDRVALEWAAPKATETSSARAPVSQEIVVAPPAGTAIGADASLENGAYRTESRPDGTLIIVEKSTGAQASFAPEFAVVFQPPGHESKMDPKGAKYEDNGPVGNTNYLVPTWNKEPDFLLAAHPRARLRASAVSLRGDRIEWKFPAQAAYVLSAEVTLPADGTEPALTFHFRTTAAGQVSVGYVGAPVIPRADAEWIWQPLVWQDLRFPNRSYLTKEFECPIPFTLAGRGGDAIGVGADTREMPFRMPTNENSRFGVLVRNAAGEAQPMLFAPVLGGPESKMAANTSYDFTLRLIVRRGAWFNAYKHLARDLYHFRDYRENALCSLNTTIENMTDFVLNDRYCYWFPRYKTWGYQNDGGPGAGRQQSAADAVSLALVFDRAEFLNRRARPTLEYMLSRNTVSTNFNRPGFMGGHVNNASDLVAAYRLTGGRTTVIRDLFAPRTDGADTGKRPPPPHRNAIFAARNDLTNELVAYRLTGASAALQRARAAANRYIALRLARPAENYRDLGSSFWTEMAPAYDLLYELYDATRDPRYLQAAAAAMRQFTAYVYLVPVVPDGNFVANPGGRYHGQPVPEEIVPAWRVAANGLASECAGTAHSHRGVFMASYAAWMARLGYDAHEDFFRDIARNAVVGRYANYPSYAYRNGYTTLYQQPDYPLRSFEEIKKFTSAHYNHPLPMTAFLVDYLVSEIYARSEGQIMFPSDYTNTGAYFRNQVYGARPGKFYGDGNVFLWLPKRLVSLDSIQVNYAAARGNGRLYLALSNQSSRPVTTTLTIDAARVSLAGCHHARVWRDNQPAEDTTVTDGQGTVELSPKGLTCLAIDYAVVHTEIQAAMQDPACPPLPAGSSQTVHAVFGEVTATALRFGRGLTSVHVWLRAGPKQVHRAVFQYETKGRAVKHAVTEFPFEITVPVADSRTEFSCRVMADTTHNPAAAAELTVRLK